MLPENCCREGITSGVPGTAHHQEDDIWQATPLQMPCVRPSIQRLVPAGGEEIVSEVRKGSR